MAAGTYRARSVKGMRDLLPPETEVWARVESTARSVFARYGFAEIRTPIVEETELFVRGVGEATDIVGKEMYTFADKNGKSLTLRPENTAPVARAFAEHGLREWPQPVRLFYIGPQFRYERPQRGRYRQFHQIGAELIGDAGPWSDAEIVLLLMSFLGELGFRDLKALINTVGDAESRATYRERLRAYLLPRAAELGEDSRRRLETNPLRILDTKVARGDRAARLGAAARGMPQRGERASLPRRAGDARELCGAGRGLGSTGARPRLLHPHRVRDRVARPRRAERDRRRRALRPADRGARRTAHAGHRLRHRARSSDRDPAGGDARAARRRAGLLRRRRGRGGAARGPPSGGRDARARAAPSCRSCNPPRCGQHCGGRTSSA